MNSLEFTTFINTLANAIANELTTEQIGILAVALTQLDDTLATISVLRESRNGEDII